MTPIVPLLLLAISMAGCDAIDQINPLKSAEADGRAIGGACRHAGRALEDCYRIHPEAAKAAIFQGWREMNDYMTENQIETIEPILPMFPDPPPEPPPPTPPPEPEVVEEEIVEEEIIEEELLPRRRLRATTPG